jgi:hypothetical protein
MKINIRRLHEISDKLFTHLHNLEIDEFKINDDYYWDIPESELYDVQKEPTSHDLGQLSDDWSDISKLLSGERNPLVSDFVDLAMILRAIGQNITG